jgi:CheY-like chemotaxis protein
MKKPCAEYNERNDSKLEKSACLEDESSIRSFVVINLRRSGYEPIEAETGEQALDQIKKNPDISGAA